MENKEKCFVNDINKKPLFDAFVKNYQILQERSKICADLGHLFLSNFLSDISNCEKPLIVIEREIKGLKHYSYAFLVLTDLMSELN